VTRAPEASVVNGRLCGLAQRGVWSFLGVPYAAAPVGPLRFAGPIAAPDWDGVRPATRYGPTAPKPPYGPPFDTLIPDPAIPGDGCLNLNVWTPEGADGLPVLVWLHGGAFEHGSGAVPTYDGSAFARDGVVCVTLNYRLGAYGFLHLPDAPANRGLLDQIAALRWVRDNIAAFGGDPGRVTLAGESAGAISVACLLAAPAARGLFAGAVLQSGAGHHALGAPTARLIATGLADRLGVEAIAAALGEVPIDALLAAQAALAVAAQADPRPEVWAEAALDMMLFEPVIDGELLPELPIRAIAAGAGRDLPVLAGSNRDELRHVTVAGGLLDTIDEPTLRNAASGYGLSPDTAVEVYRDARRDASAGEVFTDLLTDWMFRIPAVRLAEVRPEGTTWLYEFSWPSPRFDGHLRACHLLELGFVFDTLAMAENRPLQGDDPPQKLADDMHACWVRFVRDGDPGWRPYDAESRWVRDFGTANDVVRDPRPAERTLWDGVR
jgi:para-nitrobenzyl esterase